MPCRFRKAMQKRFPSCPGPRDLYNANTLTQQGMANVCPWCRRIDREMFFDPVRRQARETRMILGIKDGELAGQPNSAPHYRNARYWSFETILLLTSLYKEAAGHAYNDSDVAFCVAGSLARLDAAPFSDIDCFVIAKNSNQVAALKIAGQRFRMKLIAAMSLDAALMLDPIGLEPVTICGIPLDIRRMIVEQGMDIYIHALNNARIACGNNDLLTELQNLLRGLPSASLKDEGLSNLQKCFVEYPIWKIKLDANRKFIINLKDHLTRPLTFCVNGLAKFHGITDVGIREQARFLLANKIISEQVHSIIVRSAEVIERVRVTSQLTHLNHRGDELTLTLKDQLWKQLEQVTQNVQILQSIAKLYCDTLGSKQNEVSPFLTKMPSKYLII
jgi:hypothetical protein